MSKASDCVKKMNEYELLRNQAPKFSLKGEGRYSAAQICFDGSLRIFDNTLSPKESIEFAQWIIETFDEVNREG